MFYLRLILLLSVSMLPLSSYSQSMDSSEILLELQKLKRVGSVLYVAAHPDDENTSLLAYMSQHEKLDTAYLSLTRGGGGQNLIGPELKEGLGVIRTNELLQARKLDGAKQLFTRARDFGYSKNPQDTLENWQEEKVLGDVVYAVRSFKPDVIITRFNPNTGGTHGHHTVSAQLALRAFDLAADPTEFPEQLDTVSVHQAKRIYWNGYSWNRGGLQGEERPVVELDIGLFNPILGTSYTELSAKSRSMHKSQGFGRVGQRGAQNEKLVLLAGSVPEANDFLEGVNTNWDRFDNGEAIDTLLAQAISELDPNMPWGIVQTLLKIDSTFDSLPDSKEIVEKRTVLHKIIAGALGVHFEARSSVPFLTPGANGALEVELLNRSPLKIEAESVEVRLFDGERWPEFVTLQKSTNVKRQLIQNEIEVLGMTFELPKNAPLTQPYWLQTKPDNGFYNFDNIRLLDVQSIPSPIELTATLNVEGRDISLVTGAIQVISDPVKGEVHQNLTVRPEAVVKADTGVLVFQDGTPKELRVIVSSNAKSFKGILKPVLPDSWTIEPSSEKIELDSKNNEASFRFIVTPPESGDEASVEFQIKNSKGNVFNLSSELIDYEHIGRHETLAEARTKLIRLELARGGNRIAALEGVGDTIPDTLERIGYELTRITVGEISAEGLKGFDTVILGPRAFDALEGLDKVFDELALYVEGGGTLISQFNTTSSRAKSKFSAPYPISLSRDRISEEHAKLQILDADHPVFNFPNKIGPADFDNWIQERGLYFASQWDNHYTALLSGNDRGESAKEGSLLVAPYGKGWYAYTGLSFFRQLPEGNPGAIRLFVNLISLGHEN